MRDQCHFILTGLSQLNFVGVERAREAEGPTREAVLRAGQGLQGPFWPFLVFFETVVTAPVLFANSFRVVFAGPFALPSVV